MPVQPCPACGQQTPRHMQEISKGALINYYTCSACGHAWTVNKREPSDVTHLTPLRAKPTDKN